MSCLRLWGRKQRGYSLVETLIGMVVLAIAIASASALLMANSRMNSQNKNLAGAAVLAESKIEELRNIDLATVVSGADAGTMDALGDPDGIYTRTWVAQDNTPAVGLKTVVVAVAWDQWGETRTYTLTGVLGQ